MLVSRSLEGVNDGEEGSSDGSESEGSGAGSRALGGGSLFGSLEASFTTGRRTAGETGSGKGSTTGGRVDFHGNRGTITTVQGLLVLGQVSETQTFVELDDLVAQAADEVNDLWDDTDGSSNTIMLNGNEATSTRTGKVQGNLVSLEDTTSVTSVIVCFQVVNGDNGTGGFDGTQDTVVVLLVGQTDEDRLVAQEFSHDLGLTGDGGLDLVFAHLEEIPGGFGAQTDQVTVTGNTHNGFLDVGICEVLSGQVEGGLDLLVTEGVQELTSVISRSVVEGEGNDTVSLTAVLDGSLSDSKEGSKNESKVEVHLSFCWFGWLSSSDGSFYTHLVVMFINSSSS